MHRFMVSGTSARVKETEMDIQKLEVEGKEIKWCETFGTLWFCKSDIARCFKKTQPRVEWMIGKLPGYLTAKLKVGTQELWFVELDGLELLFRLNHIRDDDPFVMAVKEMTDTGSKSDNAILDDSSLNDITNEQKEATQVDGIINIHGVQCYEKGGVRKVSVLRDESQI